MAAKKTTAPTPENQRATDMNPNNPAYEAARKNRAEQLNPEINPEAKPAKDK